MTQSAAEMVAIYIQAEKDVLEGKTTVMNGRTFTMENLNEIRDGRVEWERRLQQQTAAAGGKRKRSPALASFIR